MREFAEQNARVKQAVNAENAAVLPETVTKDLADGVYRADVQRNGLSVLKEGENFFVVQPATRHISRALGAEELTSTLRGVRGEVAAEGRLAIGKTVENKPFVEIENDILGGVPESEWIKTVKRNLATKFPNGVVVGNSQISIDSDSRKELTYSEYMKWLRRNNPDIYADKLRATDNADEILSATTDWINEEPNHTRKDDIVDFARGRVLLRIGEHDYAADVVVGTRKNQKMRLYDVINLDPISITKKETSEAIPANPSPGTERKTSPISDTSITENAKKSNSFAEKNSANDANSDTSVNLDGGRREQAPALQGKAQTESEQTAEDGGKARREEIAIDVWARENIPDYAGLNAPARAAVRATVRTARAQGIAENDIKTYARVAARSGLNISFDTAQAAGGDAWFDERNTIYVNPAAPAARIQSKLLLHEGGHALFFKTKRGKKLLARAAEMVDAETAAEVRKRYTEYYEKRNVDKSVYEPIIQEEIAAAGLEKALGVDGAWEFILAEQPTLGERFLSFFRGAARDYAGVGNLSAEARKLLRTYQKAFAELAAYNQGSNAVTGMISEKMQVSGENDAKITGEDAPSENKKAANEGGRLAVTNVENARRITMNMPEAERAAVLRECFIRPTEIKIADGFDVDFEQLEKNRKSVVEKPLVEKLRKLGFLKAYKTDVVDVEFEFTGGGLRKSMNSQVSDYGGTLADLAKVVMNMQGLLDQSVLLEVHSDKAKGTALENPQLVQTFVLLSAFQDNGTITPVQFEIKQYVDNNNRLYLAVALTKIKTGVMDDSIPENQASTHLLPVSTISIPDLIQKINPRDENFFKYAPDAFLSDKQLEAKRRALEKDAKKYQKKEAKLGGRFALPQDGEPKVPTWGKESYSFAEVAGEKLTAEEVADFQGTLEKKVGVERTKYKAGAKDFVFTRAASVYIDTVDELYGISHFLKRAGGVKDAAAIVNVATLPSR